MKTLSRNDVGYAIITGLIAGILGGLVLMFLDKTLPAGLHPLWLMAIIPLLWLIGVQFGYFLGQWMGFFNEFGKYVAIGFTNFAVDEGVFNFLLSLTHAATGFPLVIQKGVSFIVAVTHSYYWNRTWAFQSQTQDKRSEFFKFMLVNLVALVVNVGVTYLVVHFGPRPATFTAEVWANVGVIAGSAAALIFSFIGFRVVVFKKS